MWYIQQLLCAFPLITWGGLVKFSYAFYPLNLVYECLSAFFQPLTLVLDFHHDTFSAFQTLVLHTPISWLAWPWLYRSHPASTTFRMLLNQSARSSYRTTGFYLWRNKDAPQTGVWAFLLYHGVSTAFFCLLSLKISMSILKVQGVNYYVISAVRHFLRRLSVIHAITTWGRHNISFSVNRDVRLKPNLLVTLICVPLFRVRVLN